MGLTSSTRLSNACRNGVVVEAVEEAWGAVSLESGTTVETILTICNDVDYLVSM